MAPYRTILNGGWGGGEVAKSPETPPFLKINYGMHTMKPQLCP